MAYLYRIWLVVLVIYLVGTGFLLRDSLIRPEPHNFGAAWSYGVNTYVRCRLPRILECRTEYSRIFAPQRNRWLEEDFNLILRLLLLPAASLLVLLIAHRALAVALFSALGLVAAGFIVLGGV